MEKPGDRVFERTGGVDGVRVDRQAGVLPGEARRGLRQAELAAHEVEEICRIGAVENGKRRVEPIESAWSRNRRLPIA